MYSSALSIEIISDVEFSRRLVESRSDKLKQGEKQLNSSGEKTTQLGTRNETIQLNSTGGSNSTRHQERNNSTQQEKTTQLGSRNETTQLSRRKHLNSSAGMKHSTLHCRRPPRTAYNRLHRLYSRIGFFYLLMRHPPYEPQPCTLGLSHLFRSLQNFLNGKHFRNNDNLKSPLVEFLCG
ncbi:hypothetical protein TNCV_4196621 [Trichonephila clavipes]|nr:hypothetical protein TNCV_4196621 [Trichonephila clavipes]